MVRWRMNDCLATTPSSRAFPSINRGRHRKRKIKHVKPASTPGASGTELARTRPDSWPRRVAAHHWPAASWLGRSCCRSFFACACPCGPAGGRLPALCGYALVLVTELTRWGRSTIDLFHTLGELQVWGISLIGLQFDLGTPQGKLIVSLISVLAEFERDLASRAGALGHCRSASARRALWAPARPARESRPPSKACAGAGGCRAVVPGGRTEAGHQQEHGAGHRQAPPCRAGRAIALSGPVGSIFP